MIRREVSTAGSASHSYLGPRVYTTFTQFADIVLPTWAESRRLESATGRWSGHVLYGDKNGCSRLRVRKLLLSKLRNVRLYVDGLIVDEACSSCSATLFEAHTSIVLTFYIRM